VTNSVSLPFSYFI